MRDAGLSSIDGIARSDAREAAIDSNVEAVFTSGAGAEALRYLRSITIERVAGPEVTDAALRHLEGSRYLVAVIEARIRSAAARRKKV